jgi:hypothetical protein
MTSFTKALYRRDPAAAMAFYHDSRKQFDNGRKPSLPTIGFGQRTPTGWVACVTRCSHPSCAQGCTLQGRK